MPPATSALRRSLYPARGVRPRTDEGLTTSRTPYPWEGRMLIAVLNQSTLVTDSQVQTMTQAIASQVKLDVAPLWDRSPAAVIFYKDAAEVPANAHAITLVDTAKDAPQGVLGFHTEDKGGRLW